MIYLYTFLEMNAKFETERDIIAMQAQLNLQQIYAQFANTRTDRQSVPLVKTHEQSLTQIKLALMYHHKFYSETEI